MKKIIAIAVIGTVAFSLQTAEAQLLFSEGFNYTQNSPLGGNTNPGNSTAWSGSSVDLEVGSTQLTYSGLTELSGNDLVDTATASSHTTYNTFSAVTSGSIYYSFLIDVTTLPTGNTYFTALNPGSTTPGGSGDAMDLYLEASGSGYDIGVRADGAAGAAYVPSTVLSSGTTYFVVEELTLGSTPTANLYLDPTPGAAQPGTPSSTVTGTTAVTSVDDVGFKAPSSTGAVVDFGNLLVGDTWADVTPSPEPSVLALAGAGLGLLGLIRFRRS